MSLDPVVVARQAIRRTLTGGLATMTRPPGTGVPYASLVLVATQSDGRPVLLLSTLAEHTQNALADARASLLFDATAGLASPLTGTRVTLQGTLVATTDDHARSRYLARHPDAGDYIAFADFGLYRFEPSRAHLVAGFGIIQWIDWNELATPVGADADIVTAESEILAHMNADHADAVALIAAANGGAPGAWIMTGCDPDGCDFRLGAATCRVDFAQRVYTRDAARLELVRLTRAAQKS
ncbi:MAG: DUF2470 domain-containing protein [Alphaproteobacteria bacterium]